MLDGLCRHMKREEDGTYSMLLVDYDAKLNDVDGTSLKSVVVVGRDIYGNTGAYFRGIQNPGATILYMAIRKHKEALRPLRIRGSIANYECERTGICTLSGELPEYV